MRHAPRTHVREACEPDGSNSVEVAEDQADSWMGRDNVAQLPSIASLSVIQVDVRNLDSLEFKDERDPLASRFGKRWA
jgi:hypothetical protein